MRVDVADFRVVSLLSAWRIGLPSLPKEVLAEVSLAFQKAFVREIVAPSMRKHSGEWILFYHKFLRRVPIAHSFAYGSEMVPQDVYRVTVARIIKSDMFLSLVETEERKISPRFLIPVEWKICLKPRYSDDSCVFHFVVDDMASEKRPNPVTETERESLDISAFGRHLFRFGRRLRDDLSWATEISLIFGDESVKAWLDQYHSSSVYTALRMK